MVDSQSIKELAVFVFLIVSFVLYFIILYLIFFSTLKEKFKASFYWIFGFSAINYMLHVICFFIFYRFTSIPIFYPFLKTWPEESIFYTISYTLMYYTGSAAHVYSLSISFNRFTVFLLKTEYISFWNKYLKYVIFICIFLPIIFVWQLPFTEIKNRPYLKYEVYLVPTNPDFAPWWNKAALIAIETFTFSILSLLMNVYSIIKWRYFLKHKLFNIYSQESRLLLYNMFLFVTELFNCFNQLLLVINRDVFVYYVLEAQASVTYIIAVGPVWFVLISNKQIREEIRNLLFVKPNQRIVAKISSNKILQRPRTVSRISAIS